VNGSAALRRDPAVAATALVLWLLLALFVVYPMAMLLARVFVDKGGVTLRRRRSGADRPPPDPRVLEQPAARGAGRLGGTIVGFVFAFTATRARLPRGLLTAIDAAVLLPLVSPPFTTAIAMIFSFGPRGLITYELLGSRASPSTA
jgi:iron(III) transport system permease protein